MADDHPTVIPTNSDVQEDEDERPPLTCEWCSAEIDDDDDVHWANAQLGIVYHIDCWHSKEEHTDE